MHELRKAGSSAVVASLRQHATGKQRLYVWTGATGCMFAEWDKDDIMTARSDVEADVMEAETRYVGLEGHSRRCRRRRE
jgi:ABC-type cobalamin transport system ATPase subunit